MSNGPDFLAFQWMFMKKVAVSFLVFGIIISILLVNTQGVGNTTMSKEKMESYIFLYDIVATIFALILLCMVYYYGFSDGSMRAIFCVGVFIGGDADTGVGFIGDIAIQEVFRYRDAVGSGVFEYIVYDVYVLFE